MDREELLRALRRMAPETGSLHCLGCGHEHSCSTHGCAVVNAAVLEINMLAGQNKLLREQLDESRLPPLTPQKAAGILRDANLGGVLRRAADMGIRALEGMDAANGLDPEEIERILDAYGRGMTLRTENGERLRIIKDIPTNRLQELTKAEKDGRLVVLPCKPGQTLWAESPIKGRPYNFEAPDIAWIIENMERFGKEIFLTREEAEAALKKREEADNEAVR